MERKSGWQSFSLQQNDLMIQLNAQRQNRVVHDSSGVTNSGFIAITCCCVKHALLNTSDVAFMLPNMLIHTVCTHVCNTKAHRMCWKSMFYTENSFSSETIICDDA